MIFHIERSSGVPVTRQILDQIRAQCAAGDLKPGDQLPSVRQLAKELMVNQNTILRVFERLEAEGLIERRHGSGTFVTDQARRDPMKVQLEQLRMEAEALVHHAVTLGMELDELTDLITECHRQIHEGAE